MMISLLIDGVTTRSVVISWFPDLMITVIAPEIRIGLPLTASYLCLTFFVGESPFFLAISSEIREQLAPVSANVLNGKLVPVVT